MGFVSAIFLLYLEGDLLPETFSYQHQFQIKSVGCAMCYFIILYTLQRFAQQVARGYIFTSLDLFAIEPNRFFTEMKNRVNHWKLYGLKSENNKQNEKHESLLRIIQTDNWEHWRKNNHRNLEALFQLFRRSFMHEEFLPSIMKNFDLHKPEDRIDIENMYFASNKVRQLIHLILVKYKDDEFVKNIADKMKNIDLLDEARYRIFRSPDPNEYIKEYGFKDFCDGSPKLPMTPQGHLAKIFEERNCFPMLKFYHIMKIGDAGKLNYIHYLMMSFEEFKQTLLNTIFLNPLNITSITQDYQFVEDILDFDENDFKKEYIQKCLILFMWNQHCLNLFHSVVKQFKDVFDEEDDDDFGPEIKDIHNGFIAVIAEMGQDSIVLQKIWTKEWMNYQMNTCRPCWQSQSEDIQDRLQLVNQFKELIQQARVASIQIIEAKQTEKICRLLRYTNPNSPAPFSHPVALKIVQHAMGFVAKRNQNTNSAVCQYISTIQKWLNKRMLYLKFLYFLF